MRGGCRRRDCSENVCLCLEGAVRVGKLEWVKLKIKWRFGRSKVLFYLKFEK